MWHASRRRERRNVRPFSALPPSNGAVAALRAHHLFLQLSSSRWRRAYEVPATLALGRRNPSVRAAVSPGPVWAPELRLAAAELLRACAEFPARPPAA